METNNSLMSASEPSSTIATTAPDILLGEAPAKMRRSNIDWEQTDISEYQGLYAVIIDDVLSPAECAELVEAAEATTNGVWEEALVNVGGGHQERRADTRNSARIIWDSPEIVARLWRRVVPLLPELEIINCSSPLLRLRKNRLPSKDIRMTRLNERMRFLKYGAGEYFRPHCDGTYITPDGKEISYYTLHLYLNNSSEYSTVQDSSSSSAGPTTTTTTTTTPTYNSEPLQGGATTFHSWNMQRSFDVPPKLGRVLIFQHRDLLHSGDDVLAGTKLTMRTDIMFEH